jgi:hypothetical protein
MQKFYKILREFCRRIFTPTILRLGRKGMVLLVEVESRDETGDVVLLNQLSKFVVGGGGFGGSRTSEHIIDVSTIPCRMADASSENQTSVD